MSTEQATFAAGCFWGVEEAFRRVRGVSDVVVGYTGGHTANPSYEQVCASRTGHAEAVRITYDPMKGAYEDLLRAFWEMHDPTTKNRQGPDIGSQYRSAIFYHTHEQKQAAEKSKQLMDESGIFRDPIVTEILPATDFWRAEEYHQRYFEKYGGGACHV